MAYYFPPSFPSHYASEVPLINPQPVYIDDPNDPRLRTYIPAKVGPVNKGLQSTDAKSDNSPPPPSMNPSPFMPGVSLFDARWPRTEMIRGPVTVMLPRSDSDRQIEQKRLDQIRVERGEQEKERLHRMSKKKKRRRRRKHRNNRM